MEMPVNRFKQALESKRLQIGSDCIQNLEAIAAIDGIGGLFVGTSDLAASMGHIGNPDHVDVQAAIATVPDRLKPSGKLGGILAPENFREGVKQADTDQLRHTIEFGIKAPTHER